MAARLAWLGTSTAVRAVARGILEESHVATMQQVEASADQYLPP